MFLSIMWDCVLLLIRIVPELMLFFGAHIMDRIFYPFNILAFGAIKKRDMIARSKAAHKPPNVSPILQNMPFRRP